MNSDDAASANPITAYVRDTRAAMSMTQKAFAAALSRSQATVLDWERGTAPDYEAMVSMSVLSGVPLPGEPASLKPGARAGFGDAHLQLLASSMTQARRRLPKTLLSVLDSKPPQSLGELAEFMKMLEDLLERYPDAG